MHAPINGFRLSCLKSRIWKEKLLETGDNATTTMRVIDALRMKSRLALGNSTVLTIFSSFFISRVMSMDFFLTFFTAKIRPLYTPICV